MLMLDILPAVIKLLIEDMLKNVFKLVLCAADVGLVVFEL